MFCEHCGKPVTDDSAFCEHCGKPVIDEPIATPKQAIQKQTIRQCPSGGIEPGYSSKINHPSFRAAVKKTESATGVFTVLLILAALVVTFILGVKNDKLSSYLLIGAVVSAVFLLFNIISLAKAKSEKQWDGVVIDKSIEERRHRDLETKDWTTNTFYVTRISRADGKTKDIEEKEISHKYYDYLNVGDRVRFHPEFGGFYEKYDKSGDTYVYCPVCGETNDITEEGCTNCGTVLIK